METFVNTLKNYRILILFFFIKLLIHLLTSNLYSLHRDEFLYLTMGDHLSIGYLEIPPSLAVFSWIVTHILGGSEFTVRIIPALLGALTVFFTGLITKEFGGKKMAQILACSAVIISPAFLRINQLFQPVSFNVFYWVLLSWIIIRFLKSENKKLLIYFGVIAGLSLLNKYSVGVYLLAVLAGILLSPHRILYKSKEIYLAIAIATLIFLPNLIWQIVHNLPLVSHIEELSRTQLVNVRPAGFLLEQFFLNSPNVLIWIFGLYFLLFTNRGKSFRILGYMYIFIIIFLLLFSGKGYYSMGAYPMLIAAGACYWEKLSDSWNTKWVPVLILVFMIISILPVLPISLPVLKIDKLIKYGEKAKKIGLESAFRWETGIVHDLPQDFADMFGWKELAGIVEKTYFELTPEERNKCLIYAENYGQAGAVDYYGKKSSLPEVVSFNSSYLLWAPDSVNIDILIYINDDTTNVAELFQEVKLMGQIENHYARENGTPVYLCKYTKTDFQKFYQDLVRESKDNYR